MASRVLKQNWSFNQLGSHKMQPVQSGLIKIMDEQIRVNMELSHGKNPDLFCIWKD
jgi:hypothetical protein